MSNRRRDKRTRGGRSRSGLWAYVALLVIAAGYLGALEASRPHPAGDRIRYDSFTQLLGAGRIESATVLGEDEYVEGTYLRDDGSTGAFSVPIVTMLVARTTEELADAGVPTVVDQQVGKRMARLATMLLPGLLIVILFGYMIVSARRGTGLFKVRSGAQRVRPDAAGPTFADVAGQDAAVAELREIRDFLASPERFTSIGAELPKGILLFGPPGCGKTLLARALANEARVNFFAISGSDFVELYSGVGAARVRELFREARAHAPSIVFIDEVDAIGRARSTGSGDAHGGSAEQEQGLNQVLVEMDGLSPAENVLVVAATNRPDVLDQALLRPGRLDRSIGLERPDETSRLAVLTVHAGRKKLAGGVDLAAVARRATGLTGADLATAVNEAALLAGRDRRSAVSQADLERALDKVLGAPKLQRRLSMRDASVATRGRPSERVTFADVAGVDDAIAELQDVRDFLADADAFARMGARTPRGILLSGGPGTGKTLLARALAGEVNASFYSVGGSEFVEMFVGRGAARIRDLFAEARATAPSIIFIDEIDALAGQRSAVAVGGAREHEHALNQLLVEMDGFEGASAVIVLAATNRPDMLDAALLRPGRFDRMVEVRVPDRAGRRAILALHGAGKPLAADVDLDEIAGATIGMSGAELANLLNEAAILATRRRLPEIPMSVVEEAYDRILLGVTSRSIALSEDERRAVAYHEAGHALVALTLPGVGSPHKLTIAPRGSTLGFCQMKDVGERVALSRSQVVEEMAVGLGGRVAERLVLGEPRTGSSSDLARVRRLAEMLVRSEAMTDSLGLVSFPEHYGANGSPVPVWSEETARRIDDEVRGLVDEAEALATLTLSSLATLDRVVEALLERETLDGAELKNLVGPVAVAPRPARAVRARRPAARAAARRSEATSG